MTDLEEMARDIVYDYEDIGTVELWHIIAKALRTVHNEALEEAAKVVEKYYGGPAHTYASENADMYRTQDRACKEIAAAIRARKDK